MQSNIRNEIVELDLNEIAIVAGGAIAYTRPTDSVNATLSYSGPSAPTGYVKPTYVKPTMTNTDMSLSSYLSAMNIPG
jgi:hypothetical protein